MGVHFRKVGVHTLSTPSRYPAQGCVKLGAHKTGCSNSPTPYNITPYRTPRNSATPGLELPALRACGENPKGGGVHSPFTIHHSPFTIHHSPFTIHHSPFSFRPRWCANGVRITRTQTGQEGPAIPQAQDNILRGLPNFCRGHRGQTEKHP